MKIHKMLFIWPVYYIWLITLIFRRGINAALKKSHTGVNEAVLEVKEESMRRKKSQRGVNEEENESKRSQFRPLKIVT